MVCVNHIPRNIWQKHNGLYSKQYISFRVFVPRRSVIVGPFDMTTRITGWARVFVAGTLVRNSTLPASSCTPVMATTFTCTSDKCWCLNLRTVNRVISSNTNTQRMPWYSVSRATHPQLITAGFCWSKVPQPACLCWCQVIPLLAWQQKLLNHMHGKYLWHLQKSETVFPDL